MPDCIQTQIFKNISAILEEAGSSLQNCVKVSIFITDMQNFAAMNKVYTEIFKDPKPVRMGLLIQEGSADQVNSAAHVSLSKSYP